MVSKSFQMSLTQSFFVLYFCSFNFGPLQLFHNRSSSSRIRPVTLAYCELWLSNVFIILPNFMTPTFVIKMVTIFLSKLLIFIQVTGSAWDRVNNATLWTLPKMYLQFAFYFLIVSSKKVCSISYKSICPHFSNL